MPVNQIEFYISAAVANSNCRKTGRQGRGERCFAALHHVVIPPDHVHFFIQNKREKLLKDIGMDFFDVREFSVFPQLIAVAELYVGEVVFTVIAECSLKKRLVIQKAVIPCAVSAVTVAENDDARMLILVDFLGRSECFVNLLCVEFFACGHKKPPDILYFSICGRL